MSKRRLGGKEPYARIFASAKDHPRIDLAGLEATGLWARALAYCADHQTDGYVPAPWMDRFGARPVKRAIAAGLIERHENGYIVHDFLDHNRSSDQIEVVRARERDKKTVGIPRGIPRGNGGGMAR